MPKIFGFSLLRNGIKYDYPFEASLASLTGLAEKTYLALGASDDGTEKAMAQFPGLVITPTVWDENFRKSGLILSQQTNIALEALRASEKSGWAFYLQADEVIAESDYAQIRRDLDRAEAEGCDAISFRYLHFWQAYDRVAVTYRWYPQEIRCVKVDSAAVSYGDAQSFKDHKKVFYSDVPIFHYGHVREASAYDKKKKDFGRWWHSDGEMAKVLARGDKKEKFEKVLRYLGPHPIAMKNRIKDSMDQAPALIFGMRSDLPEEFWQRVKAPLQFSTNLSEFKNAERAVFLRPLSWWQKFRLGKIAQSKVGEKMDSPQARPWAPEFIALLKLSEKGVSVGA